MEITIFWDAQKGLGIRKDEKSLSFKHRVGPSPVSMKTQITLDFPDCINLRWKRKVEKMIKNRQFRKDCPSMIRTNQGVFHLTACRDPKEWSNKLANLMLINRKNDKNDYDNVTKETVMNLSRIGKK
jgi:hypothetical protein